MNYEYEIQNLKEKVANLQETVIQMARNNSPIVSKVDSTANAVDFLTPYKDTAKAYFNETEKIFYNVPEGNLSVFFTNYNGDYSTSRVNDRVTISFDALTEATDITIMVQ
jgi:hypothetical protein